MKVKQPSRLRPPRVKAVARARVDRLMDQVWDHRVTLLLAPAGSGKTTAMAEFALRHRDSVGWLTCNGLNGSAATFTAAIDEALHQINPSQPQERSDETDPLGWLRSAESPVALAIDDEHTLFGTDAEWSLQELIEESPAALHIVLATRRPPGFDLGSLQMMGQVHVIDSDDLRFRSWESEQLFNDVYETRLPPDDMARLSRRVDGWAAGLQMFHLAARGMAPLEQRNLIDRLSGGARIVREYLATNVLEPISAELRTFLIDTSVLGVVTPRLADELRRDTGSDRHLEELAASLLFTAPIDDEGTYRYHEVLRSHLEMLLIERDGEASSSLRFGVAAELLERDGFIHDAMRCFARSGDLAAVRRLANPIGTHGSAPVVALIHDLPESVIADDPWLLLHRGLAERSAGRWTAAIHTFHEADAKGVGSEFGDRCRADLAELASWLDPLAPAVPGWGGLARAGCRKDPGIAAHQLEDEGSPSGLLAAAALLLLLGDPATSISIAEKAVTTEALGPHASCTGMAILAINRVLNGEAGGSRALDEAAHHADRSGCGWIARLLQAAMALTDRPTGVDTAARVRDQCDLDGDPWGAALACLFGGLGTAHRGLPAGDLLVDARNRFQHLGAGAFQAVSWLAAAELDATQRQASAAFARAVGLQSATHPVACFIRQRSSMDVGNPTDAPPIEAIPRCELEVACLGSFHVRTNGVEIDLDALRPKARSVLKLLAIHPEAAVHRESIIEALWPDCDVNSGIHNVQVATSAVRKMLAAAGVDERFGVQRSGEAYRLTLPSADACDLAAFLHTADAAKAAATASQDRQAVSLATAALSLYRGELLAEDGPLDWIVPQRRWISAVRESVATIAASWFVEAGRYDEAIDVCEATILDCPYADELWRLLMRANRERGDLASARRAEARYDRVLAELDA